MRTALFDAALIDYNDLVRVADSGKAMRDDDRRPVLRQPLERSLYVPLTLVVERRGRLIQDQDARIFQKDARNGDALLLPAGKTRAAFADRRVVTELQALDKIMDIRVLCGGDDLLVGGARLSISDVVADRAAEHIYVLLYDADRASERFQGDVAHILAVNTHRT